MQSRELNALVKAHNVILFCNQEQCPCVSNACQITADVMEDIRPFALMMEECRELYALLSAPHVRVSYLLSFRILYTQPPIPKGQENSLLKAVIFASNYKSGLLGLLRSRLKF